MSIITWEKNDTVAVVQMNNGDNKQNLEFALAMNGILDEVVTDLSVTSMVITSSDMKNWSVGVDVNWVMEQLQVKAYKNITDFMYGMNQVFRKLLIFPFPTIAAINGHAFGNGAILSCACDFRFMRRDRGYFCFPEVDLGIPFLPGMAAFIQKAIPFYKYNELKLTGKRATADELEADHVIEKACADRETVIKDAMAFAGTFQKKRNIFETHKKRMHNNILEIMDKEDPEFIDDLRFLPHQE